MTARKRFWTGFWTGDSHTHAPTFDRGLGRVVKSGIVLGRRGHSIIMEQTDGAVRGDGWMDGYVHANLHHRIFTMHVNRKLEKI